MLLLSIKSEFAEKIFTGKKTVELRKGWWKPLKTGHKVLIYETFPEQAVTGWFEVDRMIMCSIEDLWSKTRNRNAISKEEYDDYFNDSERGNGIFIRKACRFVEPITLQALQGEPYNFGSPPQSRRHLKPNEINLWNTLISQFKSDCKERKK